MSIDTSDQSEILKYYKKFLTIQESTFFSVRLKNGRSTMKIFPLKNSGLQLQIEPLLCKPSDISSLLQDPYHFSYYTHGKCFYERSFPTLRRLK